MFVNQPSHNRYTHSNKLLLPHIPTINKALGGELLLVDMKDGELSRVLDRKAGVDGYVVQGDQIKSIALRVRKTKGKTFTIRSHSYHSPNTELHKIPLLIASKATYPILTLSLSLNEEGGLLYGCCVYTKDLFRYILENQKKVMNREEGNGDGSRFVWVKWSELERNNVKIKRF